MCFGVAADAGALVVPRRTPPTTSNPVECARGASVSPYADAGYPFTAAGSLGPAPAAATSPSQPAQIEGHY
jgi:hypothetical protein